MRMRKKKWVSPFLESETEYLLKDFKDIKTDKPIYIEIGMGMGDFITQSAYENKDIFYIGLVMLVLGFVGLSIEAVYIMLKKKNK